MCVCVVCVCVCVHACLFMRPYGRTTVCVIIVSGVYTTTAFSILLLQEVFPHSTNLELLSVVVADHLLQQNHQPPSPFPSSSLSPSPSLTPLHWAKVLTSSAVVEAVAGELLKTTRDHLDQNSDILDQSEQ